MTSHDKLIVWYPPKMVDIQNALRKRGREEGRKARTEKEGGKGSK